MLYLHSGATIVDVCRKVAEDEENEKEEKVSSRSQQLLKRRKLEEGTS